jgi:hypothetical protein
LAQVLLHDRLAANRGGDDVAWMGFLHLIDRNDFAVLNPGLNWMTDRVDNIAVSLRETRGDLANAHCAIQGRVVRRNANLAADWANV